MSFIVQSIAIWSNRGLRIKPPETLATFAISSSFGIPNVALVALLLSVIAWLLLDRTFTDAGLPPSARVPSLPA